MQLFKPHNTCTCACTAKGLWQFHVSRRPHLVIDLTVLHVNKPTTSGLVTPLYRYTAGASAYNGNTDKHRCGNLSDCQIYSFSLHIHTTYIRMHTRISAYMLMYVYTCINIIYIYKKLIIQHNYVHM